MDNITHSLFALTLANAGLRQAGRGAVAALLIASNIPDIEILTAFTGGRVGYLVAHRGPTHGPLGLVLAVAVAGAVWMTARVRRRTEGVASLAALAAVSAVGVAGHIAMDFATSYGTRVLSPFLDTWYGVDWVPIVDVYLWLILACGLVATRLTPAHRTRIAAAALLLVAGQYALRATSHAAAVRHAISRQAAAGTGGREDAAPPTVFRYLNAGMPALLPAALPTFTSPFRWRIVTRTGAGFEVGDIDLLDPDRQMTPLVFPNEAGGLVEVAAAARLARIFLDFSRFPAAEAVRHRNGDVTVHWYDLRFAERAEAGGGARRHTSPFAVWVRLSPTGSIVAEGLGPG